VLRPLQSTVLVLPSAKVTLMLRPPVAGLAEATTPLPPWPLDGARLMEMGCEVRPASWVVRSATSSPALLYISRLAGPADVTTDTILLWVWTCPKELVVAICTVYTPLLTDWPPLLFSLQIRFAPAFPSRPAMSTSSPPAGLTVSRIWDWLAEFAEVPLYRLRTSSPALL